MAINKLTALNNGETPVSGDWENLVAYQSAFMRQVNSGQYIISGTVIKQGSYIQHGGVLYRVDDEDYTILGSVTSGAFNYIIIEDDGTGVLNATWTTDISSYNWNYIYSELLESGETGVLPYAYRDSVVYKLEQKNIVYRSDQAVDTDSDVEHASLLITDTDDVSPTSTDNPFQIGEEGAENMAFDTNQILVRDGSGGLNRMFLNYDGTTGAGVKVGHIILSHRFTKDTDVYINNLWTYFNADIPNTGDLLAVFGQAYDADDTDGYKFSFMERINSTTIWLYWLKEGHTTGYTIITSSDTSYVFSNIQVAW